MEVDLRRQAVDRAYRAHAEDVYRVVYAILRDPEGAADVTQDVFAKAFERWDQYDASRPLRAWLHGIAAHAALDVLRRRRVRDFLRGGSVTEIAGDHGALDPARAAVQRQTVDAALALLQPQARAVLVLRHFYGYEYEQIAGFLGTSPGNVGSTLTRAHAQLRRQLTEADGGTNSEDALARRAAR